MNRLTNVTLVNCQFSRSVRFPGGEQCNSIPPESLTSPWTVGDGRQQLGSLFPLRPVPVTRTTAETGRCDRTR